VSTAGYAVVVVTGAGGFLGRHLLRLLETSDDGPQRVVALDVRRTDDADGLEKTEWVLCDLTDCGKVQNVLEKARPDGIIHLAGVSGGDDLSRFFESNVLACARLLRASQRLRPEPRILIVGSAAQYGITGGGIEFVDESRPLLGQTPYAVSKIMQEQWSLLYGRSKSLPVICVRPFNIIGPGQPTDLVPATFIYQVFDVLTGRADEVCVGDISTSRDFTDVRDVVAAFWSLLNAAESANGQVFNVASGQALKISDILDACIELSGRRIKVRQDPARFNAGDVPAIVGSAAKIQGLTGWSRRITWRQSLEDMWGDMTAETT